ncbi:deleted in malignant brain tumors 1 protein-like isoform X2 [Lytechinus pictus]|uniref:deleted in malignant brain tumors 1 protein-like isoform X2 n=1 Tax=Lytechinus pictus TaxID=7653 RepID=UPI0030B9CDC3
MSHSLPFLSLFSFSCCYFLTVCKVCAHTSRRKVQPALPLSRWRSLFQFSRASEDCHLLKMASNIGSEAGSGRTLWIILSALLLIRLDCVLSLPSDGDIRLANGSRPHEGRVEIYHDSQWGTICDDGWTGTDASVVCRQLGYSGGFARTNLQFGSGFGPIWLDDVACSGFESRLEDCLNSGWNNHNCVHSEDAGVSCTAIEGDITLVDLNGNSNILEGRVEIFYNGDWGTICDDDWGNSDARVVCRQLGYVLGEGEAKSGGSYGVGSGPIHLDGMDCSGFESVLTQCDNNGWGIHNCIHSEDAGVDCSVSEGTVRLVDGYDEYEGRVEILHDGQWGTVCDDSWGDFDARVVCRQLGYSTDNAQAMIGGVYGRGTGPIYLDEVGCLGHESSLTDCSNTGWGVHNCVHSEDAGVQCGGRLEGSIRLVGGNSLYEGRVEIYHAGQWGTICDNSWGDSEARAVCRQLGYPTYEAQARTGAEYGQGTGSIHLDDVVCFGYEAYLTDCSKGEWGVNYCVHSDDAGVQCVSTTVPPPVNPLHSRIVGIMSFVGVSLSLLTLFSIVAVWYTCSRPKPVTNPTTSQQIPLGNVTSHPAAHNTPASPATNGMTYPTQVATQPAIQPPPAPQQTLNSNPYPPETTARSGSSPPEYMSIVDSQTDSMPPPN